MYKVLTVFLVFIFSNCLKAQVLPAEGVGLHYRIIGFSFPKETLVKQYKVEIAEGFYKNIDSFKKKVIVAVAGTDAKIIAEVPAFGKQYTWHVVYTGGAKKESPLYHFSTLTGPNIDTSKFRLRVMQAAEKYKDMYVAVDKGGVIYDMKGNAVWYIPEKNGVGGNTADLKFTDDGTITFLYGPAYEINYDADVLWKSPDKSTLNPRAELYHHEFRKLPNGHYMALGMELLLCKVESSQEGNRIIISPDNGMEEKDGFKMGRFGGLIEYDEKGNVVWMWKSSKYLQEADLAYFNPPDTNMKFDAHDNAFFFDEKNSAIYVGFKHMNRVIKIEYPSGKVTRTYGHAYKPGTQGNGDGLFCCQHNIGRTTDGYLYYFNNNACTAEAPLPTIVMIQEPESPTEPIKKIWEYRCMVEGAYTRNFYQGGNAIELPGNCFFVNMGSKYSKLFIVSRDKKELWSALPERFVETDRKWLANYQYRATIISRKDLERLIWTAQQKK